MQGKNGFIRFCNWVVTWEESWNPHDTDCEYRFFSVFEVVFSTPFVGLCKAICSPILKMQFNKTLQTKKFQQDRENFLKATAMSLIGKITSPTPTLDSTTTIFDAIEYLIINDCDHAFVQHEGEMVGIVRRSNYWGITGQKSCLEQRSGNIWDPFWRLSKMNRRPERRKSCWNMMRNVLQWPTKAGC